MPRSPFDALSFTKRAELRSAHNWAKFSQIMVNRQEAGHLRCGDAPFFVYKNGERATRHTIEETFWRLRQHVGVGPKKGRHQPRLHDLRHTFAVHRLIVWYRNGDDVQRLLPGLSTHLGHVDLASTQLYLTMTPELLVEASLRFEHYAGEVVHG